jgi:hypothetical protein
VAGYLLDEYSEEDRNQWTRSASDGGVRKARLPPISVLFEESMNHFARLLPFRRIGQLFVTAKDDHARPFLRALDIVHFDADEWVAPHPADFLSDRRKAVKIAIMVGVIERRDIGLRIMGTSEPAQPRPGQKIEASLSPYVLNLHVGKS